MRREFPRKIKAAALARAAGTIKPRQFLDEVIQRGGDDCILWPFAKNDSGYGQIWLGKKVRYVHRVVCQIANGAPAADQDAAHSCGKKLCCNSRHLRWATRAENHRDKIEHGTHLRGARQNGARLTDENVREIRRLKGKLLQREIAELFGVSRQAISDIHLGSKWGWLDA